MDWFEGAKGKVSDFLEVKLIRLDQSVEAIVSERDDSTLDHSLT